MCGNPHIVALLLSHADINVTHTSKALWTAIDMGRSDILEVLLQHDIDPNQYAEGDSLLAYALSSRCTSFASLLVADKRTDLDIFYQKWKAATEEPVYLILELMTRLPLDDLTVLLSDRSRFAIPEILDNLGNTALHLMAKRGHLQWCQTLLEEFPEMLYMANQEDHMPLGIALNHSMTDVCDLFYRHDATCYQTPNVRGEVPLMRVIRTGYLELLRRLQLYRPMKEHIIHSRGRDGSTFLMEATKHGRYDTVKELVSLGVDPNAADRAGYTALILAARQYSPKSVEALLNFSNVDINKHDNLGWNALIWAKWPPPKCRRRFRKASKKIEKLLVARGANVGLLLDNVERNKRSSSWRLWLPGPRRTSRRRALISDA